MSAVAEGQAPLNQQQTAQPQQEPPLTLSMYDPEFRSLITVPRSAVYHLPAAQPTVSSLILCRCFDPSDPSHCPDGARCKFVHVDLSTPELKIESIHVNYAYKNLGEVQGYYPCLPPGQIVNVVPPAAGNKNVARQGQTSSPVQHDTQSSQNTSQKRRVMTVQQVPTERILVTAGVLNAIRQLNSSPSTTSGTPTAASAVAGGDGETAAMAPPQQTITLPHCAHYHVNRICHWGDRCGFVHTVYLDPKATPFQRAPKRAGIRPPSARSQSTAGGGSGGDRVGHQAQGGSSSIAAQQANGDRNSNHSSRTSGLRSRHNPYSTLEPMLLVDANGNQATH